MVLQIDEDYLCDSYLNFIKHNPSEKILTIRKNLKLSRIKFANLLSVNAHTIKRWERNASIINRSNYYKLIALSQKNTDK